MHNGFIKFEFKGFNPESELKNVISSIAEKLHLRSPSDAGMKLAMNKSKDVIQASCEIASRAGTFVAHVVSDSPLKAIQKIEEKILDQLDTWKRHRFSDEKK